MADWHRLTNKTTGETYTAAALDGIDLSDWEVVPIIANRAPGEFQTVDDKGAMTTDLDAVKASAAKAVDQFQREEASQFGDLIAAITVTETWADIKRGERDIAEGKVPATGDEINQRYPFLAAISAVAGVPIDQALSIAKAELWPQMVDVAMGAARALLARRAIQEAASVSAVQTAADDLKG